jgi:hypothetical protein
MIVVGAVSCRPERQRRKRIRDLNKVEIDRGQNSLHPGVRVKGGDSMFVPLSYGEDGTSFEVPENEDGSGPAGWLVLRKTSEGRGRPAVVHHRNGKPLIVPIDATHDDLLRLAGKGRYRLQVVDQYGRKLDGVPAAHTGMLAAYPVEGDEGFDLDQEEEGDDSPAAPMSMSAGRRPSSIESVLC